MKDKTIPVQLDHCAVHTRDWTKTSPAFFDCGFVCNGGRNTALEREQCLDGSVAYGDSGPLKLIHFFFENSYVENYCTPSGESFSKGIIDPECHAGLLMFVFATTRPFKAVAEAKQAGYRFQLGNSAVGVSRYADHGKNKGQMYATNGIVEDPPMYGYIMAYQHVENPELTYDNELYQHPNTVYRVEQLIVCCNDDEIYNNFDVKFREFSELAGPKYRPDVGINELRLMDSEAVKSVFGVDFPAHQRGHGGIVFLAPDLEAVKCCIEKSGRTWRMTGEGLITEPIAETGVFFLFRQG